MKPGKCVDRNSECELIWSSASEIVILLKLGTALSIFVMVFSTLETVGVSDGLTGNIFNIAKFTEVAITKPSITGLKFVFFRWKYLFKTYKNKKIKILYPVIGWINM